MVLLEKVNKNVVSNKRNESPGRRLSHPLDPPDIYPAEDKALVTKSIPKPGPRPETGPQPAAGRPQLREGPDKSVPRRESDGSTASESQTLEKQNSQHRQSSHSHDRSIQHESDLCPEPYSDLIVALDPGDKYPVLDSTLQVALDSQDKYLVSDKSRDSLELAHIEALQVAVLKERRATWRKTRHGRVIGLLFWIFFIGLALTLLMFTRQTYSQSDWTEAATRDICNGNVCTQILAATVQDFTIHLVARSRNNTLHYTNATLPSAEAVGYNAVLDLTFAPWEQLSEGTFKSQPAIIADSTRGVLVLAPAAVDRSVYSTERSEKAKDSTAKWSTWRPIGATSHGPVALCTTSSVAAAADPRLQGSHFHTWTVDYGPPGNATVKTGAGYKTVVHGLLSTDRSSTNQPTTSWDVGPGNGTRMVASVPAVVCSEARVDLLVYGDAKSTTTSSYKANWLSGVGEQMTGYPLWHRAWTVETGAWSDWTDYGGSFLGDPVVVPVSDIVGKRRFEFFGVEADGRIRHMTWRQDVGNIPNAIDPLGNENGPWDRFQSVPSAVVTDYENLRIDVVALSLNGTLKHQRAGINGKGLWYASEWETLGTSASGQWNLKAAPLLVSAGNSTILLTIGRDSEIRHSAWSTGVYLSSWNNIPGIHKDGRFWTPGEDGQSLGKDWSTEFSLVDQKYSRMRPS